MALAYMRDTDMQVSALSTSAATVPFYAKCGWRPVRLSLLHFPLDSLANIESGNEGGSVRHVTATELSNAERECIKALYSTYSANFDGLTVRGDAYWARWIFGREMGDLCLVRDAHDELLAYAALKEKDGMLNVHEFACSEALFARDRGTCAMKAVLAHVLRDSTGECSTLRVPAPLGLALGTPSTREDHDAFMYQSLMDDQGKAARTLADFLEAPSKHVLFDTDAF